MEARGKEGGGVLTCWKGEWSKPAWETESEGSMSSSTDWNDGRQGWIECCIIAWHQKRTIEFEASISSAPAEWQTRHYQGITKEKHPTGTCELLLLACTMYYSTMDTANLLQWAVPQHVFMCIQYLKTDWWYIEPTCCGHKVMDKRTYTCAHTTAVARAWLPSLNRESFGSDNCKSTKKLFAAPSNLDILTANLLNSLNPEIDPSASLNPDMEALGNKNCRTNNHV